MRDIDVADTRNFVLLGHTASGKTTLSDTLLYKLGVSDRAGSVADGTSICDTTDEEKARKITIYAKPFSAPCKTSDGKPVALVFSDTPGYADFFGQVIMASSVADAALLLVDATSGIQVGTSKAWRQCEALKLPRAVVITGIDRENANYARTLEDIQRAWGKRCVPAVIPAPGGAAVADVLAGKGPADAAAEAARSSLLEAAAEGDDALLEKFLGGEELTPEEVAKGLRAGMRNLTLIPVFACAAPRNVGITELLDGIRRFFPSPLDRKVTDAGGKAIDPSPSAPFVARVWRTVNDPFVGQLTYVRVWGGTFRSDSEVANATKEQKERIASLLVVNGKKPEPVAAATAGDIVALTKLKSTAMGDTLCATGQSFAFAPMVFPSPVVSFAVTAKSKGDEDKIGIALSRVSEEDPTVKMERHTETRELVISGLGDVQIDVAVGRMKQRSNVEVVLSTPKVSYKETVTAVGDGHYRHKKQSGGRGQYGEVYLKVMPKPAGEEEWFEDAIVGGAIPNNFIPAVQKGVVEGMVRGAVAGYPVVNVKVTLYDGTFHDVDSSEIAFKIAASRAFKDGMSKAKAVLLEPIMKVKVLVPDQYMGDINGDLSHRRGRILGMESPEGMQQIIAEVPQSELFRYAAELRSMTGGRGSFEMEFLRYDVVPSNIAQKVIAAAEKQKEEEE